MKQLTIKSNRQKYQFAYRRLFGDYYRMHFSKYHATNNDDLQKEYQKTYFFWKSYFEKYLDKLPKVANILDVGCGLGHNLYALKKLGYKNVVGIDLDKGNLQICQKNGFKVIRQDMFTFLDKKVDQYDMIIFFDVIEHLYKDEIIEIIQKFYRSLRSGGLLIIHTLNAVNPYNLSTIYIDITHEIGLTAQSLNDVLSLAGFTDNHFNTINSYYLYHPNMLIRLFRSYVLVSISRIVENYHRLIALGQGIVLRNLGRSLVSFSYKE